MEEGLWRGDVIASWAGLGLSNIYSLYRNVEKFNHIVVLFNQYPYS